MKKSNYIITIVVIGTCLLFVIIIGMYKLHKYNIVKRDVADIYGEDIAKHLEKLSWYYVPDGIDSSGELYVSFKIDYETIDSYIVAHDSYIKAFDENTPKDNSDSIPINNEFDFVTQFGVMKLHFVENTFGFDKHLTFILVEDKYNNVKSAVNAFTTSTVMVYGIIPRGRHR